MQSSRFNFSSDSVNKQSLNQEILNSKLNKITRSKRQSVNQQSVEKISNKKTLNKKMRQKKSTVVHELQKQNFMIDNNNNQIEEQDYKNVIDNGYSKVGHQVKENQRNENMNIIDESTRETRKEKCEQLFKDEDQKLISKEANDLLEMILNGNDEKSQKDEQEINENGDHFRYLSQKEKYEYLLYQNTKTDQGCLPMPYHFIRLQKCLDQTDFMITQFQKRKKALFFGDISKSIEESSQVSMKVQQLRQLLFILPECYHLEYIKNDSKNQAYDLLIKINIGSQENMTFREFLQYRKQKLQNEMQNYVKQKFKQFQKQKGNRNKKLTDFDINTIQELEMGELPKKPVQIKDFLSKDYFQQKHDSVQMESKHKLNQIMNNKKDEMDLSESTLKFINKYRQMKKDQKEGKKVFDPVSGLSYDLINRIKEKEINLKKEQEQMKEQEIDPNYYFRIKKEELQTIVEMISSIYTKKNVSNIFYITLLDNIVDQNKQLNLDRQDIMKLIEYISENYNNYMKFVDNKLGKIVRIDRNYNVSIIIQDVKSL